MSPVSRHESQLESQQICIKECNSNRENLLGFGHQGGGRHRMPICQSALHLHQNASLAFNLVFLVSYTSYNNTYSSVAKSQQGIPGRNCTQ